MDPHERPESDSNSETFEESVKEIVDLVIEEIESQDLDFNVQKDVLATVARGIQRLIEEAQQNLEEGRQNVANYNSSNTTTIDNGEYPETPVPATTARGQQATPRIFWLVTRKILEHTDELYPIALAVADELSSLESEMDDTNHTPDDDEIFRMFLDSL